MSVTMQTLDAELEAINSRSEHVRAVFEDSQHYLKARGVDVMFRAETVRAFAMPLEWTQLLDVGCGDGSISLQLLSPEARMTLLDLSASMAALAKENVSLKFRDNVVVRNENFMTANLDTAPFDLIVTVGVMAHVDSPDAFLARIKQSLRPGGSLIIEFTDARHIVGRIGRFLGLLKELVAPPRYQTNKFSFAEVAALFEKHHLKLVSTFRYSRIPLPGLDRILSHRLQYLLARLIFNDSRNNTNASSGNEYICLLNSE
jgi:SAM-dependent methyltransferase